MNSFTASCIVVAVGGLGSGRLIPTSAALVGLVGIVLGGLAIVRPGRRLAAVAAGVAGVTSLVIGGLHAANSAGGFGTGNGLAGALVAIVAGLISLVLYGLALKRPRMANTPGSTGSERSDAVSP